MVTKETVVYFNGELKPESQVGISIRDRGYLYGDAVFDATRTFNGTPRPCLLYTSDAADE